MARALTDAQRQRMADDIVDLATAFANALAVHDSDGRDLVARIRFEAAGTIRTTDYEASGGGRGAAKSDPTANGAISRAARADTSSQAMADLETIEKSIRVAHAALAQSATIAGRWLPRRPRMSEADETSLALDNRDPGCDSCRRVTTPKGSRHWSPTYRTGHVPGSTENRKRASGLVEDSTDRLAASYRLCQQCWTWVHGTVMAGAQLPLSRAIPLSVVRDFANGKRVMQPAP